MERLDGRTVLVTGAASGIGLATAELFAARGTRVALNYLPNDERGPAAVELMRANGHVVIAAPGDVSSPHSVEKMVSDAIAGLGRLDFLVNNAGTPATVEPISPGELDRLTDEFWATILGTNLLGPFRCTRAAASALKSAQGAVCNTASVAGRNMPGSSMAYGASKAGLINLTKNLARALAPQVRVNAVAPGIIATEMSKGAFDETAIKELVPMKRAGSAAEVAELVAFLASPEAGYITGQIISINGGMI